MNKNSEIEEAGRIAPDKPSDNLTDPVIVAHMSLLELPLWIIIIGETGVKS